jgi:hypothetical protein
LGELSWLRTRRGAFLASGLGAILAVGAVFSFTGISPTAELTVRPQSVPRWVDGGGRELIDEVRFSAYALVYVRNNLDVSFECSKLAEATQSAVNYGPIPDSRTQAMWSTTLASAQNAVTNCSAAVGGDPAVVRHPVAYYSRDVVVEAGRLTERLHQQVPRAG